MKHLTLLTLIMLALAAGCGKADTGGEADRAVKQQPKAHDPCIQRLGGDWWSRPVGDVRFDFENEKYHRLGYGVSGDQTLGVSSCEADRAILLIDGEEHLVELEEGNVARIWDGPDPKDTVGLRRLKDNDGHLELAAPYSPQPNQGDGGVGHDELAREIGMIGAKSLVGQFPDAAKTEQLEQACADDLPAACAVLGRIWKERGQRKGYSEGHLPDVQARGYLEKACDLGHARACADAIWITRHGDGTASRAFADRACSLGDKMACEIAASYRRFGYGGPVEEVQTAAAPDGGK